MKPAEYKVAVYIKVRGGWWTKPYWAWPLTNIKSNGSWSCDITTGGVDQEATGIIAYLVPNGYNPSLMYGGSTLPAELDQKSLAKVETTRSQEPAQEDLEASLDFTSKKVIVTVIKYPTCTKSVGFFIDNEFKKLDKKAPFSMKKKVGPGELFS